MSAPSLLSLPAEVRLNIYSHLFDDECLYIDGTPETSQPRSKQHQQPALAPILRTCQFLRNEASPSYFSKVKIHCNVRKGIPSTSLYHWLHSIGEENVRLLRNFSMRWENYVDINLELNRNAGAIAKDITPRFSSDAPVVHDKAQNGASAPSTEIPSIMLGSQLLFKAPVFNPTTSTRVGPKHVLTMEGVAGPEDRTTYWKANGTAEFCNTITMYLSQRIGATLEGRGLCMSSRELVEFIDDASSHAASMRWLWYW